MWCQVAILAVERKESKNLSNAEILQIIKTQNHSTLGDVFSHFFHLQQQFKLKANPKYMGGECKGINNWPTWRIYIPLNYVCVLHNCYN